MSYVKPELVVSPKDYVSEVDVIYDGGENSWALAKMKWDGNSVMAMRWNRIGIGHPSARGFPTWFVLPSEISDILVKALEFSLKIKT